MTLASYNGRILRWVGPDGVKKPAEYLRPTYPTDSIVARYDFNDNLTDSINSYILTPSASTHSWTYGTGLINKSIFCNTTVSSEATMLWSLYNESDIPVYRLVNADNFSISVWLKITNANANVMQPIMFFRWTHTFLFGLRFHGQKSKPVGTINGSVCIQHAGSPEYTATYNTDMRDNTWHHYVITYGSGTVKLYVDNIERISEALTKPAAGHFFQINGGWGGSTPKDTNILNGHMDLLYLYAKTLTTSEVSQLYNNGSGV